MPERKVWSQEEDKILKLLREERGVHKWANIARIMETEFNIAGRTGKQCRERYHNHLDSSIINSEWTADEQQILFEMHEQIGNKWSIISQKLPGRSDNCVKNHFYSKLRKSLRKLNKLNHDYFEDEFKVIRECVLSKIIKTTESKFKTSSKIDEELAEFCNKIKNRLFKFSFQEEAEESVDDLEVARKLISDIELFDKDYKKGYKGLKLNSLEGDLSPAYLKPPPPLLKKRSSSQSWSSERSDDSSFLSSSSFYSSSDFSDNDCEQFQKGSKTTGIRSGTCSGRNSDDITVKSEGRGVKQQKSAVQVHQSGECERREQAEGTQMKLQQFAREYSNLIEVQSESDFYNECNPQIHYNNMIYDDTPMIARILGPNEVQSNLDLFQKGSGSEQDIEYKMDQMQLEQS